MQNFPADEGLGGGDPEMEAEAKASKQTSQEEEEEEEELDPEVAKRKAKQLARKGITFQAKEDPKVGRQPDWHSHRRLV